MGKHAARKTSQTRRVAAVTAGTFVLCLGAASPAAAASIDPTPVTDTSVTDSTLTDPPPIPQPIGDVVREVSDAAGIDDPLDPTATETTHHHKAGTGKPKVQVSRPGSDTTDTTSTKASKHRSQPAVTAPTSYDIPGLRAMTGTQPFMTTGRTPSVANTPTVTRIAPAAGSRPLLPWPQRPSQEDTGRLLLVAIATIVLGGLASGHIKVAQQRFTGF